MPLPLTVLSGFLGSGKTTLLNRLLTQAFSRDTAVLINEFGSVGIDHHIMAEVADDVVLLESGCLCCKAEEDVGSALTSLLQRRSAGFLPAFRRVILETSGVADPGLLLQRFLSDTALAPQVRIQGVVTVVDAVFGPRMLDSHAECGNQIAMANQLAISKCDLVDAAELETVTSRLRSVNPLAPVVTLRPQSPVPHSLFRFDDAGLSFAANTVPAPPFSSAASHSSQYETFCLRWTQPLPWSDLQSWLEGLLIARGESILRLKGLLHVQGCDRPMVVQAVQHALYEPTMLRRWPEDEPCSSLVFITKDFSSAAAVNSFRQLFSFHVSIH